MKNVKIVIKAAIIALTGLFLACSDPFEPYGETPSDNTTIVPNPRIGDDGSGTQIPAIPTGVSALAQSSSSIRIQWNAVSGATRYNIYRANTSAGTFMRINSTTSTFFTDTGLPSSTTRFYRVSAENSRGTSATSSIVSATTSGSTGTIGTIRIVNNDNYAITQWYVRNSSGVTIQTNTVSIPAGSSFSISVAPGTYSVRVVGGWFGWLRDETTQNFRVIAGHTNNVTLTPDRFSWQTF